MVVLAPTLSIVALIVDLGAVLVIALVFNVRTFHLAQVGI